MLPRVIKAAETLGSGFPAVGLQPTDDNHREPKCPEHRPRFRDLAKNRIANVRCASFIGFTNGAKCGPFLLID
jgi:hypothetical protein